MCTKPIDESGYSSEHDGIFCCEKCYLDYMIQKRSRHERDEMQIALGETLMAALDARESETGMHSKRVACHTQGIGKIAIPDAILLKEGALTEEEWSVMHSHPQRGYDIVVAVPFMSAAAEIILTHEERYDGSGYPQGLSGDDIPWGARLFAIIDTLDAMTSDRPYRRGMSFDASKEEILRMSGSQFDPKAVEVFVAEEAVLREMVDMKCAIGPGVYQSSCEI
jgi:HD-GYP domain-containing protein (c-di-GMP phosphodiesterase class II)